MLKAFNARRELFICLFLIVATLAVFWQVKDHDFINYDDNDYITENLHVQAGLTLKSAAWAFTTFHAGNWHPLTWLSHMLDCQLFGLKPGWHHVMNLFFHITNTLLLFLVLHRMTKALWQCAFVAAVFALHPLHVESVAWVAERKDVLSTFFWMLTMGAYVYYVERPGLQRYLLAISLFALGLMAKPMLVTLPFVLLLLDYWPLGRLQIEKPLVTDIKKSEKSVSLHRKKRDPRRNAKKAADIQKTEKQINQRTAIFQIILEKVPFFVLSVLSSVITYVAQQKGGAVASLQNFPLSSRIANALVSYCGYIGKMFWPDSLAVLYPHPGMLPPWQVLGAALFLVMTTLLVIWTARRFPYLTVGWLWYVGTLVPVIGIVQVGSQGMADRYTYVPLVGLFIAIAWGVPDILKKWRFQKVAVAVLSVVILSLMTIGTWEQVRYWQNSVTLFRHALDGTSNNYIAHSNLGHYLLRQGKIEEAVSHYSESLRIYPNGDDEHNNLGMALQKQGRIQEAIRHYTEAIRINPYYSKAYVNLGEALASQGKYSEAMTLYSKALRIKPDSVEVHYNMGTMLASQGKIDEAITHFWETIRIKPEYAKGHNNLGSALLLKGKKEEAIVHFREALRLKPDYTMAQENLKDALSLQKKSR